MFHRLSLPIVPGMPILISLQLKPLPLLQGLTGVLVLYHGMNSPLHGKEPWSFQSHAYLVLKTLCACKYPFRLFVKKSVVLFT